MSCKLLCITLLAAAPAALSAQSHPFVGSWAIEYPAGARHEGGEIVPIMAKAKVTVESVGDSLIAMVATEPSADRPARPPARLAAKRVDGTVTFVNRAEAKVRMNDEESTRISITTWTFTVTGDELAGTIDRRIEGLEMAMAGPQSFKGTRAKS